MSEIGSIDSISIERVFNLGDYKSLRVSVTPNEMSDEQREQIILENVLDAYKTLFIHQLITAELYDGDTEKWEEMLEKLEGVRHTYLNEEA